MCVCVCVFLYNIFYMAAGDAEADKHVNAPRSGGNGIWPPWQSRPTVRATCCKHTHTHTHNATPASCIQTAPGGSGQRSRKGIETVNEARTATAATGKCSTHTFSHTHTPALTNTTTHTHTDKEHF